MKLLIVGALTNIASILERHGSSMDRVVKCTAMLADMSEWAGELECMAVK